MNLGGRDLIQGVFEDITERERAEEVPLENERRYRLLAVNVRDVIFTMDMNLRFTYLSPSITRLIGYSVEEAMDLTVAEILTPASSEVAMKILAEELAIENMEQKDLFWSRVLEIELNGKDGSTVWAEVKLTFLHDPDGRPIEILGVARDITERKRAEEALQRAHAQNEQLLASISSILIGVDQGDRITHWNTVAETTFGIKASQVMRQPFFECDIQWDWTEIAELVSDCRERGWPTQLDDILYMRPDGKEGFLNVTVNPFVVDEVVRPGFLLLAEDITERKIIQSQLAQAQKLKSIGQLAAGIAHEINTPTQYVGDNTRFLQESFTDIFNLLEKYYNLLKAAKSGSISSEQVAEVEKAMEEMDIAYLLEEIPMAIEQALEGVDRVSKIVRAMKEFSHPYVGEKEAIDINKAIESTITVSRNEWKYVAEIETDFDLDLPLVPCLPGEFNQVILNLLINSAHAIGEVVGDGSNGKGAITIGTHRDGDWAEIRISDTGKGIPEEIRSKIFDPFFTTKEVGKGTGQGLAIAHSVIVEKHGGTITFETEEGRGTTFIIRLPINGLQS